MAVQASRHQQFTPKEMEAKVAEGCMAGDAPVAGGAQRPKNRRALVGRSHQGMGSAPYFTTAAHSFTLR